MSCCNWDGRLFHTFRPAKLPSPKAMCVHGTAHVLLAADWRIRWQLMATGLMLSARYAGAKTDQQTWLYNEWTYQTAKLTFCPHKVNCKLRQTNISTSFSSCQLTIGRGGCECRMCGSECIPVKTVHSQKCSSSSVEA